MRAFPGSKIRLSENRSIAISLMKNTARGMYDESSNIAHRMGSQETKEAERLRSQISSKKGGGQGFLEGWSFRDRSATIRGRGGK